MRLPRFSAVLVTAFVIGLFTVAAPHPALAQRALGIDVSSYQGGSISWSEVKSSGVTFAWAKATQGNYYIDADFTINEANAKAAGVYIGAYDFADYNTLPGTSGADTEAAYFWAEAGPYITGGGAYLMPMLDVELAPDSSNNETTISAWVNEWCNDIVAYGAQNGVVVKPVVYTYVSFADDYLSSSVTQWPLDMASPNGESAQTGAPNSVSPWSTWTFWQYDTSSTVPGVTTGDCDQDVFNGTVTTLLQQYVIGSSVAPAGATLYWDPSAKKASPGSGGTGSWDLTTQDWWYSGSSNVSWAAAGDNPIFAGTAGTVTLNTALTAGTLTFQTAGYTITGTANTLSLTNSPAVISVPPPGSSPVNVSCILSGYGYTVTGGGVFVLNNTANSLVGPINIVSNSTLVIASSKTIGASSGTVTLNAGILQNNDATSGDVFLNTAFNIVLGANGGYLNDNINASLSYGGIISGTGSMTKIGGGGGTGGTLILNGTNTYTGGTVISQGVLALGATGSINDSSSITIDAGASLDVSATAAWTLGSSTTFTASGAGTTVGTTAATLKGASGGTASLGSQPVTLVFTPTATNGDVTHPSLYVSQGTLVLSHGNIITISNASGSAMGVGLYTLIDQNTGSISGAPYPKPFFSGAGVVSGMSNSFTVSGGQLTLNVQHITTTTLSPLASATYGQSVTLTATVSPSPSGGSVQFYDNGVALGSAVSVNSGTASYTTTTLAIGNHPITATYGGTTFYAGSSTTSSSTQQITVAPLSITASPESKTYGTLLVFGSGNTNFFSSGLQNGQTIGSVTLAVSGNGGATSAEPGTYTITPSSASGGTFSASNYSITYSAGTLTVNPATLTVTATSFSQPYGATNPVFTVTYTNFVDGQTLGTSDVAGSPDLTTSANTNSPIGAYVITNSIGTLTSTNYSFNLVNGTLTVTNAISTNVLTSSENPALPGDSVTFTATLSALVPSLAVPGGTVQFQLDGSLFGSPVTLSNGVAVSSSIASLSHGYHTNEADYAGDTNIAGSTNILVELINTPPIANPATYTRAQNSILTIAISSLLTNATDPDGDPISLAAVSATSTNGAVITTNATSVIYTPPATNGNLPDAFSYTVADIYGATGSNIVAVTIQPPALNITGIDLLTNGTVQLNFAGVPGCVYLIEAATNLSPPVTWTPVSTNTANTNGGFCFTDGTASNYTARYYRAASQ